MNSSESLDLNQPDNSLTGSLLVASHRFDGTCNEKLVVLVNYHNREFVYGLALNKLSSSLDELALFYNLQMNPTEKSRLVDKPVFYGEPTHRRQTVSVLHEKLTDNNFIFTEKITDNLFVTKSSDIFYSIATGEFPTKEYNIYLGHMMWTEKQMYRLLKNGFFFRLPPDNDICLRTPAEKCYQACLEKFNFNLDTLNLGPEPSDFDTLRQLTGAGKQEQKKYNTLLDSNDF